MLFDPLRHVAVPADEWDPAAVRAAIREIVDETLTAGGPDGWPPHELDDGLEPHDFSLYVGAAGVLWGLDRLMADGLVERDERVRTWAGGLFPSFNLRARSGPSSYLCGDLGIMLTGLRVGGDRDHLRAMAATISHVARSPMHELLYGAPGALVAAILAWEATEEEIFADAFRTIARDVLGVWRSWRGLWLWPVELGGGPMPYLGAAHGLVGNVACLWRGQELLLHDTLRIEQRANETVVKTAIVEDGCANWPALVGGPADMVQWCHGAPGVLTSLWRLPWSTELATRMRQGGELIWLAGPLAKGSSLCHGTAGSGAALLALYQRTDDPIDLARARSLAMQAVRQVEQARAKYGRGRFSLWTGDVGVAWFLADCLEGTFSMPTLDR